MSRYSFGVEARVGASPYSCLLAATSSLRSESISLFCKTEMTTIFRVLVKRIWRNTCKAGSTEQVFDMLWMPRKPILSEHSRTLGLVSASRGPRFSQSPVGRSPPRGPLTWGAEGALQALHQGLDLRHAVQRGVSSEEGVDFRSFVTMLTVGCHQPGKAMIN